jgi:L-fuconolactonase
MGGDITNEAVWTPLLHHTRRHFLAGASAAAVTWRTPAQTACIDSHVHVWASASGDVARFPFAAGASVPPGFDASVDSLVQRMKANRVDRTVLIQVIHYRWDNSYLVDCLRRFPKLFIGICRVNPKDPAAPDHLTNWTEKGCRGVRLSPGAGPEGDWILGPLMRPLWKRCGELQVPMTLLIPASRLRDLTPLLDRFPNLSVVIDHMADCPPQDDGAIADLLALARYPRVFVKITHPWSLSKQAYPFRDTWPLIQRVRDAFGSARLMGGTDWPIKPETCTYEQRLALYREWLPFFNDEERADILHRTVRRVWPGFA